MDFELYKRIIEEDFGEKFTLFKELLKEYNGKFNLTSITDDKEIYIKHFLDSVVGEKYFDRGGQVVEIGSGGGFPSVPLKIIREDLDFTLIESIGKKCEFLDTVIKELNFGGAKVLNMRAEDGARKKELRESFDYACARAVARLSTLLEYCLPFVKVGGRFIAWKGDADEEIEEAENALKILGGKLSALEKYELPDDCGKRTLIVIDKLKSTPPKYPRGQGMERKRPL